MGKVGFIGHREAFGLDTAALRSTVEELIGEGYKEFIVGTHGVFDSEALRACKEAKERHPYIEVEVVLTSLNKLKRSEFGYNYYEDLNTKMYEIENEHFKRKIIVSNRYMIDECDVIVCYVYRSCWHSGAALAYRYAEKTGKRIINLYKR